MADIIWVSVPEIMAKLFLFIFVLILLDSPRLLACSSCYTAQGGSLNAFRWSTFFLSLVPLLFASTFGFWFYRQLKKQK